MVQRKIELRIRKTHRYLGLIIGIQFLAWTVSGLYFSWTDLGKIHGDQFINTQLKPKSYSNLIPLDSITKRIEKIDLVSLGNQPYYWINDSHLYNAKTGILKEQISESEALAVAQENLISGLEVEKIELLQDTGPHHEFRGRPLPAYAIHFRHPDILVAYVDASSGIFQRIRHQSWRWFDFLWMSHTMDYKGRDNFNNILLRIFSLFGVLTVMSGFLLWGTSSLSLRKLLKR